MLTIGLLWHSFISGNLGVSALTDANMTLIAQAAHDVLPDQPLAFILFGPRGDSGFSAPEQIAHFEYVEVSSPAQARNVRRKLAQCDLVFDIGAGDSFSDIYGIKRFAKIAGLKFMVPQMRQRLVISPQTIGPFAHWWARAVAAAALNRAAQVFVRDDLSADRARALMRASRASVLQRSTDVAFALERLPEWPAGFPAIEPGKTHIALNVSGLLHAGGYRGGNQFGLALDYRALIDTLIANLAPRGDVVLWLVPHVYQISKTALESDLAVSRSLAGADPRLQLAPLFRNAREAKTFISAMDLVIAARMHAAIAAVSSGVACVPLSYSVKFQGLFNSLGYPYTVDLKSAHLDDAVQASVGALDKLSAMRDKARSAAALAEQSLDTYRSAIRGRLLGKNLSSAA